MTPEQQLKIKRDQAERWKFDQYREGQLKEAAADPSLWSRLSPSERATLGRYKEGKEAAAEFNQADSELATRARAVLAGRFQVDEEMEGLRQRAEKEGRSILFALPESTQLSFARYLERRNAAVQMGFIK